jgi:hypothetical protein
VSFQEQLGAAQGLSAAPSADPEHPIEQCSGTKGRDRIESICAVDYGRNLSSPGGLSQQGEGE